MNNKSKIYIFILALISFGLVSCHHMLDQDPLDDDVETSDKVYDKPEAYKEGLARLYAGLAVSGQDGAGSSDISGIDAGFGQYLRGYFYHQEFTTDEAHIAWNDQTVYDFHNQSWGAGDVFITAFYSRVFYQVTVCNQFLRETTDAKLDERGHGTSKNEVATFRAEARFLRALSYWHAIDCFGAIPFVTEDDPVGFFNPEQKSRTEILDYLVAELKDIIEILPEGQANEYGRADKVAAQMLLAKLYLNAEVYTGNAMWAEALEYTNAVIASSYSLEENYANMFMADNDQFNSEAIFTINFDGTFTQTWGGTGFIINASIGGDMNPVAYGTGEAWAGLRTTAALVEKFVVTDTLNFPDKRAMFFTDNQTMVIKDIGNFNDGYAVEKFTNLKSDGTAGSHGKFADTDFPMFRLSDAYLMYAELAARGVADVATAVGYVNDLRLRAYGDNSGDIATADLKLDFVLDERARELYWECHRRTDLIRFKQFSDGNYVWPWKGGDAEGIPVASYRDLFPIPFNELAANPTIVQNPGY